MFMIMQPFSEHETMKTKKVKLFLGMQLQLINVAKHDDIYRPSCLNDFDTSIQTVSDLM